MSTTINFKTTLVVGEQDIPLASEVVFGAQEAQSGVKNGFLFKLDRQPFEAPVTVYLGDLVDFLNQKLGVGGVYPADGIKLIGQVIPALRPENFARGDQTIVHINEFTVSSHAGEYLFRINLDVENSDPNAGLIPLPRALTDWLKIKSLAIAFTAERKS